MPETEVIGLTHRDRSIVQGVISTVGGSRRTHLPPLLNRPRQFWPDLPLNTGYGVLRGNYSPQLESASRYIEYSSGEFVNSDSLAPVVQGVPKNPNTPSLGWDALQVNYSGTYLIGLNLVCTRLTATYADLILTFTGTVSGATCSGTTQNACAKMVIHQATFRIGKNNKPNEGVSNYPQSRKVTVQSFCGKIIDDNLSIVWPIELDAGDRIRLYYENSHGLATGSGTTVDSELWVASHGLMYDANG